jgi:peroxiredoxin
MRAEGATAPAFELPGVSDGTTETFSLTDALADDRAVLLLFYPFDFSPVCTTELCAIQDAQWFEFTPDLDVWAVSADSTYAHEAFADEYGLTFPLLTDAGGSTADAFDVRHDELQGHENVPQRAVFLVDDDRTIQYSWATEDVFQKPDFTPVKRAVDELADIDPGLAPDGDDDGDDSLEVSYGDAVVPNGG